MMNRVSGYTYNQPLAHSGFSVIVPEATVNVYDVGTLDAVDLYADAEGAQPLANPLTSDLNGFYYFYCQAQRIDRRVSGGLLPGRTITTPYTLGDSGAPLPQLPSYAFADFPDTSAPNAGALLRRTDGSRGLWMDSGTQWFSTSGEICNVKEFGATGGGISDESAAIQAAVDACAAAGGGTVLVPPGTYLLGTDIDLSDADHVALRGVGEESIFDYHGPGFCLDVDATSTPDGVIIDGFRILVSSTSTGALRVGRTNQAYSDLLFRQRWILRNLTITGAGSNVAGSLGISLTQVADSLLERISITNVESAMLCDRTTVNQYTKVRTGAFVYGWEFRHGDAPGACNDALALPEFNGPERGADGWGLKVDHISVRILAPYFEYTAPVGVTCKAMLWVTSVGSGLRMQDGWWDASIVPGTLTATMQIDAGCGRCTFVNQLTGATVLAPITVGAPGGALTDDRHLFIGCDAQFATELTAALTANRVQMSSRGVTWADGLVIFADGDPTRWTANQFGGNFALSSAALAQALLLEPTFGHVTVKGYVKAAAGLYPTAASAAIPIYLSAAANLNFDLSALTYQDLSIACPGATQNMRVALSIQASAMVAGIGYIAWCDTDLVWVRAFAIGGATPNPPNSSFQAGVFG